MVAGRLFDPPRELLSEHYEILQHGGRGEQRTMICGAVRFEHPAAQRLVSMLPGIITMEASRPESEWIVSAIRFMTAEAKAMRPGGDIVITQSVANLLAFSSGSGRMIFR